MTISNQLSRIGAAVALVAALSACQTSPPPPPPVPQLQDMLAEASKASASGDKKAAIGLWKKSAEAYPKEKAPWSSIAQTHYDAKQYGDAIQAALEVLVRDPNDTLANSIIAVSGLRLSTNALGDLSRQNNLSGPIKSEAQDLANLLRKNLGTETLLEEKKVAPPRLGNGPRNNNRSLRNRSGNNAGNSAGANAGSGAASGGTPAGRNDDPFKNL